MNMFSTRKPEPQPSTPPPAPPVVPVPQPNGASAPAKSGNVLSRGVSIKGSVKFSDQLLIDGEVEGAIDSTGALTIAENGFIRGEVRAKSVKLQGKVEGNIFATERCELQAGCTLRGDVEAPRLVVDETATLVGSAKVGTPK